MDHLPCDAYSIWFQCKWVRNGHDKDKYLILSSDTDYKYHWLLLAVNRPDNKIKLMLIK